MAQGTRVGVYPGSFNPPTVAHLAIVDVALAVGRLDRVDLVVSRRPLGKAAKTIPSLEDRMAVLERIAARRGHLGVRVSEDQLLADIAADADAVILGADKWAQVLDPRWYGGDPGARDAALRRLPLVLVAPRPPTPLPVPETGRILVLEVKAEHQAVSSTAARAGRTDWMAAEAAEFDAETGAWSRPEDYRCRSHHRPGRDR